MSLVDFLGFIFSFGFFVFLMIQRAFKKHAVNQEKRNDPYYEEKQAQQADEDLKEFLRSIGVDEDDEELPQEYRPQKRTVRKQPPPYTPPPPPRPALVVQKTTKVIESSDSPYDIEILSEVPRVERVVNEISHLKNMMIYHEIFGPPKAYRDEL